MQRFFVYFLLILAVSGTAACGGTKASRTALRITLVHGAFGSRAYTLRCEPPGGTIRHPRSVCAALAASPTLVRRVSGCPFGPPLVRLVGSYRGRHVDAEFSICTFGQEASAARWIKLAGYGPTLIEHVPSRSPRARARPKAGAARKRLVPLAIAFWDGRRALLARTSFRTCGSHSGGEQVVLERTSDGGRSWQPAARTCASPTSWGGEVSLATGGPESAWLGVPGGLLRTTDGGHSWSLLRTPPLSAFSFASPSLGWGVRGTETKLVLLETRTGGRTWQPLRPPCPGAVDAKVSLPRPRHGWFLCLWVPGAGNQAKAVYETRDKGRSWRLRTRAPFGMRPVGRLGTYGYPIAIVFRANGQGWLPQGRGATLVSRDGGRSWAPLAITQPEARLGLSVSLVSDDSGFILIQDGIHRRYELERTADGGRTWRLVYSWASG